MTYIGLYQPNELNQGVFVGDSRLLMSKIYLPDQCVDIVFTSPPYNVGIRYENWNDKLAEDAFWQFNANWLTQAYRVTTGTGRLYATVSDKMLWRFRETAESVGWKFHQLLVWCKPNISGGSTRVSCDWNTQAEWCLLFHRDKRTSMLGDVVGVNTHNWMVTPSTQSNYTKLLKKVHPAQMAYQVAFNWLARTPGDVVLDPFMGSGTTGMAAKALGKRWLGFENGRKTAEEARERISRIKPIQQRVMFEDTTQAEMDLAA